MDSKKISLVELLADNLVISLSLAEMITKEFVNERRGGVEINEEALFAYIVKTIVLFKNNCNQNYKNPTSILLEEYEKGTLTVDKIGVKYGKEIFIISYKGSRKGWIAPLK